MTLIPIKNEYAQIIMISHPGASHLILLHPMFFSFFSCIMPKNNVRIFSKLDYRAINIGNDYDPTINVTVIGLNQRV